MSKKCNLNEAQKWYVVVLIIGDQIRNKAAVPERQLPDENDYTGWEVWEGPMSQADALAHANQ